MSSVQIKEEDFWKNSFNMRQCLCEWLVIHFNLSSVPPKFMHLMNHVLHPFIDSFFIVYLNGILIFSSTQWEEHGGHLK
jgi:hypothetical protein